VHATHTRRQTRNYTHLSDEESLEFGSEVGRVDALDEPLQAELVVRRRRRRVLAGRRQRRALRLVLVELHLGTTSYSWQL